MENFKIEEKVRINKPALQEHGLEGTVRDYNEETRWYFVELDNGPPWRGHYNHNELEKSIHQDEDITANSKLQDDTESGPR